MDAPGSREEREHDDDGAGRQHDDVGPAKVLHRGWQDSSRWRRFIGLERTKTGRRKAERMTERSIGRRREFLGACRRSKAERAPRPEPARAASPAGQMMSRSATAMGVESSHRRGGRRHHQSDCSQSEPTEFGRAAIHLQRQCDRQNQDQQAAARKCAPCRKPVAGLGQNEPPPARRRASAPGALQAPSA